MRAFVPAFDLRTPRDLAEALSLVGSGEWKPFAGGTEIMVQFEAGRLEHKKFVNIWPLRELRGIRRESDTWVVGALATYGEIIRHPDFGRDFPMMVEAARATGAIAIQNRGTVGGNVVNASPAADTPPVLLVHGAEIELVSSRGERRIPYADFHLDYKKTRLEPGELVKAFRIPRLPADRVWQQHYRKVGTRKAQALSKICLAGLANFEDGVFHELRLAIGAVAPTTLRLKRTEAALKGRAYSKSVLDEALRELDTEIAPLDDIRSTARYRRMVARNLVAAWVRELAGS